MEFKSAREIKLTMTVEEAKAKLNEYSKINELYKIEEQKVRENNKLKLNYEDKINLIKNKKIVIEKIKDIIKNELKQTLNRKPTQKQLKKAYSEYYPGKYSNKIYNYYSTLQQITKEDLIEYNENEDDIEKPIYKIINKEVYNSKNAEIFNVFRDFLKIYKDCIKFIKYNLDYEYNINDYKNNKTIHEVIFLLKSLEFNCNIIRKENIIKDNDGDEYVDIKWYLKINTNK